MNQCVGCLVNLPGRGPVNLDPPSIGFFRKPCEKMAKAACEQRQKISLRRAVRIELKKQVAANGRGKIKPLTYPRGCWQIVAGDFSCLKPRHDSFAEPETERPSDHQQVATLAASDSGCDPAIEGSGSIVRVIRTPVDLVDHPPLGRRGERGHGELGVAAEIA